MANLVANCLSKSPLARISDDQFTACISEGKNVVRNTLASTGFGVLANATMENQTIPTYALPALIGSVIEPATNAVADRLHVLLEKKYVELFNKNLPLQEYCHTPAYKCAATAMKLALPVLITSYASQVAGYDLSILETAIKGFVIPKLALPLADIIQDKVQTALAKNGETVEAAVIIEPVAEENLPVDIVILPAQE